MYELTIITLVKDNIEEFKETITSIANIPQSDTDLQVIVVDGSSNENSQEIKDLIREKQNFIYTYRSPDGIYSAMNEGVRHISGRYVNFLNSGDIIASKSGAERIITLLQRHSDEVLFTDLILKVFDFGYIKLRQNITKVPPCHQTIYYPAHVFEIYNFDPNCRIYADEKLSIELLENYNFYRLPIFVNAFSLGGVSGYPATFTSLVKHSIERQSIYKDDYFRFCAKFLRSCIRHLISKLITPRSYALLTQKHIKRRDVIQKVDLE